MIQEAEWDKVRATFQHVWGYREFRPPQEKIVRSLLQNQDALVVLPTGAGKSVCFQLPALVQAGLTVVISPLVALMENQVQELQRRRLPAALLHSQLPPQQRKQTLQSLQNQQLKLLYLSPETLFSPQVWQRLSSPQLTVNRLVIDEAHCLVCWGQTFRPSYQRLGAVRSALLSSKPAGTQISIAAFTATADLAMQQTIIKTLRLETPERFITSPHRPNLILQVQTVWSPRCRRHQLLKFIQRRDNQSGLIYVRSRRDSESLAVWFQSLNYKAAAYHAGLDAGERRQIESNWLEGKLRLVVCTSAFSMGIDKSNVRWIVHFHAPQLLSEYLQEIGRGGRDGQLAHALTLIGEPTGWLNSEDKQRNQFFVNQLRQQYQQAQQIAKKIPAVGEVETVAKQFTGGEVALALLHSAEQLVWLDPFHYQRLDAAVSLTQLSQVQQHSQSQMRQYLRTRRCRWQFLLQAFGFQSEATGLKCGHCDNCRRRLTG